MTQTNPIQIKLQPSQFQAFQYLLPTDKIVKEVLFGGAKGGGKSFLGCTWLLAMAWKFPQTYYFVARAELNDLRKYTLPSFYEAAQNLNIEINNLEFNGQDNFLSLWNGSRIYFLACKHQPSDPMFERFGSMQHTAGWIEEAGEINYIEAYENLKKTVGRWKNREYELPAKLLITCNPKKNWLYREFYIPNKIKKLNPEKKFCRALPTDNHFLPEEYIKTLESGTKRDVQRLRYGIWEYDDNDNCLMTFDKINDIFTNSHVQGDGNKYMTIDLAITNDDFVCFVWDGLKVIDYFCQTGKDEENIKSEVFRLKNKHGVPSSNIAYDADGMGMAFKKAFAGMVEIHNGTKLGKQYENAKTHFEYQIAELVNQGKIYISCQMQDKHKNELIEELQMVKVAESSVDGKMATLKKTEVKKLIGRSPDKFDALKYRMIYYIIWNK